MLNWIFKFLLGDDIFVSYSRSDGATYAAGLANELTKLKFSCKLDQWGTQAGAEMPDSLKKSLKRSAVLVLVGTEGAAKSRHVASEIEEFKRTGRVVVPIIFDGVTLKHGLACENDALVRRDVDSNSSGESEALWAGGIEGLPVSYDKFETLKTGDPAAEIVNRIEKTFTFSRKDERLKKTSLATAIFLLLLLADSGAASVVAFIQTKSAAVATQNAVAATNLAAEKEQLAAQKNKEAEEAAAKAALNEEIANRKTEEARVKTEEADKATQRAEQEKAKADTASKLAAEKTKLAAAAQKEAEKQTKIAETKRKEAEQQAERSRQLSYAVNIQRAAGLYKPGQIPIFSEVLDAVDKDFQNSFEWSYLKHLPGGITPFDTSAESAINYLTFTPDGEYLITNGLTSSVLVWDAQTGEKTNKIAYKSALERDEISDTAFSSDKKWFAFCGKHELVVWDRTTFPWTKIQIQTAMKPSEINQGESSQEIPENFILVSFIKDKNNADINNLLTVSQKQDEFFLRRWDIYTKKQIGQEKKINSGKNQTLHKFLPNGQLLVTYESTDSLVQISSLDADLKETKLETIPSGGTTLIFSEDGSRAAHVVSTDARRRNPAKISIYDINNHVELQQNLKGFEREYYYEGTMGAFSPDGKFFAFASAYLDIKIWDIEKNEIVRTIPTGRFKKQFIEFSPDSNQLAFTALDDKSHITLNIWYVTSEADVFTFNDEEPLVISSDGLRAVTTNEENETWTLWNTIERTPINTKPIPADFYAYADFSPDGKHLFTAFRSTQDETIIEEPELWDAATGDKIDLESNADCKPNSYAVFSSDGKKLAAICKDNFIRVWNAETGKALRPVKTDGELSKIKKEEPYAGYEFAGYRLEFVHNDSKIAIYDFSDRYKNVSEILEAWDIYNGTKQQLQVCSQNSENIIKISPDGKWWITLDDKENYRLRNKINKQCDPNKSDYPKILNPASNSFYELFDLTFSNDSRYIAVYQGSSKQDDSISESFYIAALDKDTPREIPVKREKENELKGGFIRFAPSGNWLVTGNYYWNMKTKEKTYLISDCAQTPAFSVDESRLITNCGDGTIKLWSLTSGQEVLSIEQAHVPLAHEMILTKDNKYLLTSNGQKIKIWRTISKVDKGILK
jgi:WD40 repeat protein